MAQRARKHRPGGEAAGEDREVETPVDVKIEESAEGLGYGSDDPPESQGALAGHAFGEDAQGTLGDEDFDPSYQSSDELDVDEISNEDRDVATGDLSALQEVGSRMSEDGVRPDHSIKEEIEDYIINLGEDVIVEVSDGDVLLRGRVSTDVILDKIDERAQQALGVRSVDNQVVVEDETEAEE